MIINKLYKTKITSSSYNVDLNATPTITATILDFNNTAVTGESVTLTCSQGSFSNNSATYTATTNSSGQISTTYNANTAGLVTFTCDNQTLQISVASNPYPVGSIYISVNSTSPATLFGGTWTEIGQGRTIIGAGTTTDSRNESKTFSAGTTGGEFNHQLTTGQLPKHTHSANLVSMTVGNNADAWNFHMEERWNSVGNGGQYETYGKGYLTSYETGNNEVHNNMQPYLVVYMWKRTA